MKRLSFAAVILLGLIISCAPAGSTQPITSPATATFIPSYTPTSIAPATIVPSATQTFTPTSIALATILPSATWTPTPTGVIVAVGGTPSPEEVAPKEIWGGLMSSDGSRQYMINGKLLNTCNTSWLTGLTFSIDSAGRIAGYGNGSLLTSQCSPHSHGGNTTGMDFKVDGTKDNSNLNLTLTTVDVTPQVSGEFGAFNLAFNTMTCPANKRTLVVPLTSPTSAEATLKFSGIMTGCAGSKDDIVNSSNVVKVQFFADCDKRPPDMQNSRVDELCK